MNAVAVPVHSDSTPYIMSTISDSLLTPLHDGILDCMEILQKEAITPSSPLKPMITSIFCQLLNFSKFACIPPTFDRLETRPLKSNRSHHQHTQNHSSTVEWVSMNYIPFGEKALNVAIKLYLQTATDPTVIEGHILLEIIETLKIPLSMKYKCMASSTWKLAINSLMAVLQVGLPVARKQHPEAFVDVWPNLADTLDKFLFPSSACTIEDRGIDEIVLDETIDCQVIELLRDEVLPFADEIPHQFILDIVVILNKGSIHSATTKNTGYDAELKLREEFAKTCFETLLQFSLLNDSNANDALGHTNDIQINGNSSILNNNMTGEGSVAGRLAITALLSRFEEVLKKFIEDERQSGKSSLPKYRLSEISFVLKAIATLIISMKKAPPAKGKQTLMEINSNESDTNFFSVGKVAWEHLIGLYPFLVDCTTTSSNEVSRSLREALFQYKDLLQPPQSAVNDTNGLTST